MRKARQLRDGVEYHVVARANRQEFILEGDLMKRLFLETVRRAKGKYDFRVTTICVMDNHFHLMITPATGESLSQIMQWILSVFAIKFNRMRGLRGHVWYDRFKSRIISSLRQFAATFVYINENPVRANIAACPEQYPYGGHRLLIDGPPGIVSRPNPLTHVLFPGFGLGAALS
ncbi:MAG: transposase [Spirochaetaceae bacterium]